MKKNYHRILNLLEEHYVFFSPFVTDKPDSGINSVSRARHRIHNIIFPLNWVKNEKFYRNKTFQKEFITIRFSRDRPYLWDLIKIKGAALYIIKYDGRLIYRWWNVAKGTFRVALLLFYWCFYIYDIPFVIIFWNATELLNSPLKPVNNCWTAECRQSNDIMKSIYGKQ